MSVEVEKMDDLEFRRIIYSDPKCIDPAIKKAAAEDPAKQVFWQELKSLETKLEQASNIAVPDGLADRLILRQTMQSHRQQKTRQRIQLAIAASVFFVFGMSFTLWQQNGVSLTDNALAHVYEEGSHALEADENISLQQVNFKLASMGGALTEPVGHVYYANFCDFNNVRSLHMVMQGENGKVSVFLVPHHDNYRTDSEFSNQQLHGQTVDYDSASLLMLSEKDQSFEQLKQKLTKNLIFST